ncbi:MAG TPA: type III secretion system cytoplasmic ring protein SctQ [Arsenophonus apicola]|uniref:type III secretion system cytoplasmic ring protein SctQ n=1 Tax=Arsenophonus apicola TaxID=2879119 RepID=UPI00387A49D2
MRTPTLPTISEHEFQLRKCFMQYRHHFQFAEQLLTLTLEQADANYNLKLTILLKNTTVIAYCNQSLLTNWLSEALDSADFSYLPLELQLSLLKEHGKFFPSLQWLNIESLHINEAKLGIKGHFNMAGKSLSLWFPQIEAIQRLLPKRRKAEKYPLVVSLSICMVPIYLTINTLNTLEIGDILLQPHYLKRQQQQLAYIEHLPWAWVSLSSHQLELINMYFETDNLANQSLTNLEEIQIPIRFEVGRQYIELQALTHLSEGSLIDLAVPVNGDVRIIANQQPLGKGQLVEIQGRLGIKVVELFAKKTEPLFAQSEELSPLTNPSDENEELSS